MPYVGGDKQEKNNGKVRKWETGKQDNGSSARWETLIEGKRES